MIPKVVHCSAGSGAAQQDRDGAQHLLAPVASFARVLSPRRFRVKSQARRMVFRTMNGYYIRANEFFTDAALSLSSTGTFVVSSQDD